MEKITNMSKNDLFALCNLEGEVVDGWKVVRKLPAPQETGSGTGGNFSVCYIVEKEGNEYFMKVLDMRLFFDGKNRRGMSLTQYIEQVTKEFNYEKALSAYCAERNIKGVISYIDSGEAKVSGYTFEDVSYIIYEKANGDVRKTLRLSRNLTFVRALSSLVAKLKSLHDVTVALQQLHMNDISHQDIKPSNILSTDNRSKIGDLGRALCFDPSVLCPFGTATFNGDWTYAPPEAFLKYKLTDEKEQLYQMDNYMLGSLIVYYICGVSFNALMDRFLPLPMRAMARMRITYQQAKADLVNAFHHALCEFENDIPAENIKEDIVRIVEYLCNPIVEKRGHPKNTANKNRTPNYDLIRTYSQLELLCKKEEIELSKLKNGIIS